MIGLIDKWYGSYGFGVVDGVEFYVHRKAFGVSGRSPVGLVVILGPLRTGTGPRPEAVRAQIL